MVYLLILVILVLIFGRFKGVENPESSHLLQGRIFCSMPSSQKFKYINISSCLTAYKEFGNSSLCGRGCIGLYSCRSVCPEDAINENLVVDMELCSGCGACVSECPVNLIALCDKKEQLYNKNKKIKQSVSNTETLAEGVYIACASEMKDVCRNGCIKCYICLDECPLRAISVDTNGIPQIDYSICDNCLRCLRKCPTQVIKRAGYAL